MKVLYFHQHFTSPRGIVGIRSYQMSRALVKQGHSVTMVCGSYEGGDTGLTGPYKHGCRRGTLDGIDVVEFNLTYTNSDSHAKRTLTFLKYAMRSIRLALTERYDVVFRDFHASDSRNSGNFCPLAAWQTFRIRSSRPVARTSPSDGSHPQPGRLVGNVCIGVDKLSFGKAIDWPISGDRRWHRPTRHRPRSDCFHTQWL